MTWCRIGSVALLPIILAAAACSVAQPVNLTLEPSSLGSYLETERPRAILVTDSVGRKTWVHEPAVRGDTLIGFTNFATPRQPASIPLSSVRTVSRNHLSPTRTLEIGGGILAVVTIGLLVLATSITPPSY
jgi:hypothetical protein